MTNQGKKFTEICVHCKKRRKLFGEKGKEPVAAEENISGYWELEETTTHCRNHVWRKIQ